MSSDFRSEESIGKNCGDINNCLHTISHIWVSGLSSLDLCISYVRINYTHVSIYAHVAAMSIV
jgi:muramidase (phage lysozyme)